MAVADQSISSSSPRVPPHALSRSPLVKRSLPNSFQRPFTNPALQALPAIETPSSQSKALTLPKPTRPTTPSYHIPPDILQTLKRRSENSTSPRKPAGASKHLPLSKPLVNN